MIQPDVFRSESGFKPMSAFVVVAVVLGGVATRVAGVSLAEADAEPPLAVERGREPAFELVDADGRTVATFVDRMDLVLSPRSMWLAHTPGRIAAKIAEVTEQETAEEILAGLLPDVDAGGWLDVIDLALTPRQATRVMEWVERGGVRGHEEPVQPLCGIEVRPMQPDELGDSVTDGMPRFALRWQPAVLLSKTVRKAHGYDGPSRWTRHLLDGLSLAIFSTGPVAAAALGDEHEGLSRVANEECRQALWARMMPTGHCIAVRGVPADRVIDVESMLREEYVSPLQMRLVRGRDRRYPTGELEIFGSWGRVAGDEPEPLPRAGMELLAERVFADPSLGLEPSEPEAYAFLVHRNRALGRTRYFLERREAEEPARVHTTLDLDLLRSVRRELGRVMETHKPAVAMAMVLDVETGDVLAVDSIEKYDVQPFAPVYYAFTPGSTFKVLTMATALEHGLVRPDEILEVGNGRKYFLPDTSRTISEAEGARSGEITAAECLAFSMNIGLVKIGHRIDDVDFDATLRALGYGSAPGVGLGPESAGMLPPLPWKKNWSHASVSFGHEVMTTLWQHAAGLAAIARGGVWRPLRLISAVEQGGEVFDLPLVGERRVFSEATCATIREMMAMGAAIGTGRSIARTDLVMATKTGTAEKVPSEICSHVAGAARAAAKEAERKFTGADYAALKGVPKPHDKSCYTSSMCVIGRTVESGEDGREIMVLVVVDEPTGKEKFGSKVAGPAAAAILAEALDRTRDGVETTPIFAPGFAVASDEGSAVRAREAASSLQAAYAGQEPWRAR